MNPDDYKKAYKDLYAGPREGYEVPAGSQWELDEERLAAEARAAHRLQMLFSLVGRVITQDGLEGALVLSFNGESAFKVLLQAGPVVDATWSTFWDDTRDPAGITSNGWSVPSVDIHPADDDIPF